MSRTRTPRLSGSIDPDKELEFLAVKAKEQKAPLPFKNDENRRQKFLQLLAEYGRITQVSLAVGCCYETIRKLRKEDAEFDAQCEEALAYFRDKIEEVIHDRAIDGWDEPVFSQRLGTQIGVVRKYDNRLLEFYAKRHIPEYRERQQMDVNVSGGVLVVGTVAQSPEDWAAKHGGQRLPINEEEQMISEANPLGQIKVRG